MQIFNFTIEKIVHSENKGKMGNRVNKAERKKREAVKDEVFSKATANIQRKRQANVSNSVVPYTSPQAFVEQTKETQLGRRGKPMTKADLIAILAKLENISENSAEILKYQTLSNDDLRSFIRLKLYAEEVVVDAPVIQPPVILEIDESPPSYEEVSRLPPFSEGEPGETN